jgi:small membrane protein
MNIIQIVLLSSLGFIFVLYFTWFRNASYDKMILLILLITGGVFVINPELTNKMARWVGVGRGADLLLYLSIVGFSFLFILFYSKIRRMEYTLTELTRNQALLEQQLKETQSNEKS